MSRLTAWICSSKFVLQFQGTNSKLSLLLCFVSLMLWSFVVLLISFCFFIPIDEWIQNLNLLQKLVLVIWRHKWIICFFTLLSGQYQSDCSTQCTAWGIVIWISWTIKTPINFTDVIYILVSRSGGTKRFAHKNSLVWACDGQHPSITALVI